MDVLGTTKSKIVNEGIDISEFKKLMKSYDALDRGLKNHPDHDKAKVISDEINEIIKWQHDADKKKIKDLENQVNL